MKFDLSSVLNNFDMSDAVDAPVFRCLEAGTYSAKIDKVDARNSRAGTPMIVIDYSVDDGEGGTVALADYIVLVFEKNGTKRRNPAFKQLLAAAGVDVSRPSMSAEELKKGISAILEKMPGRDATLDLKVQAGQERADGTTYPDRNQVQRAVYGAAENPLEGLVM